MIKIAVCDDIIEIASSMKTVIEDYGFSEKICVEIFASGKDLYKNAVKERYHMIFMDIELEPEKESGENGMELSNRIKTVYPEVLIVFITGYPVDKNDLLNFEPFRFIEKPIQEEEVIEAVEAGIKRIEGWEDKFFKYKIRGIWGQINIKEIVYFLSKRPYIEIHSVDETITFREKMDNIEERMREISDDFVRVNKSCLVNRRHIRSLSSREAILMNGERILVGRKYSKRIKT